MRLTGRVPGGTRLMFQETSLIDDATLAQYNIKEGAELHMVKSHIALLIEDNHGEVKCASHHLRYY